MIVVALAATTLVAGRWALSQSPEDALDPVRVAGDTHRLALENAFVRVLDVHLPPGKVEPRHRHPHGMSVYFTDWEAKVTVDGKPPEVRPRRAGTFAWSEAIVHSVENVGRTEGHILRIELKF
jgi:quercetin dioxygenase-like cupin family protein